MITQYVHDTNTGSLVTVYEFGGKLPELRLHRQNARGMARECAITKVREGSDAFNAMVAHFGSSNKWPPGWWDRLGRLAS